MIDILDANAEEMWATYFCRECEELFQAECRYHANYKDRSPAASRIRKIKLKKFTVLHEHCGEKELDARLATYIKPDPENKRLSFIGNCYLENPKMSLEEIQMRWEIEKA